MMLLSIEDESFCKLFDLASEPVAITKDGNHIRIFTKSIQTFDLNVEAWTTTIVPCPFMNTLKEVGCKNSEWRVNEQMSMKKRLMSKKVENCSNKR